MVDCSQMTIVTTVHKSQNQLQNPREYGRDGARPSRFARFAQQLRSYGSCAPSRPGFATGSDALQDAQPRKGRQARRLTRLGLPCEAPAANPSPACRTALRPGRNARPSRTQFVPARMRCGRIPDGRPSRLGRSTGVSRTVGETIRDALPLAWLLNFWPFGSFFAVFWEFAGDKLQKNSTLHMRNGFGIMNELNNLSAAQDDFCGFRQAVWLGSRMARKRGFATTSVN